MTMDRTDIAEGIIEGVHHFKSNNGGHAADSSANVGEEDLH